MATNPHPHRHLRPHLRRQGRPAGRHLPPTRRLPGLRPTQGLGDRRRVRRRRRACEARKAFIASASEPIDTREPHGQFVAELLVAQARMESANTSARQTRKAQEQREQGLPPTTGLRCFGYDLRYTKIIEEEAAVLREGRDRLFAGDSLRSLALDLEARGIVGTQGHAWRARSGSASTAPTCSRTSP